MGNAIIPADKYNTYVESVRNREGYEDVVVNVPVEGKRTENQVNVSVQLWLMYVHPRAKEYWNVKAYEYEIERLLRCIARCCLKTDDPILPQNDTKCIEWYGSVCKENNLPTLKICHPNNDKECKEIYVNKLLVFLYADEESTNFLKEKRKQAFAMICGNYSCINLSHVSMGD